MLLVISSLISFIKDQVKSHQKKGTTASFIGGEQEEANFQQILKGEMNIIYSFPEAMLSNDRWHGMVSVVVVAVDEVHCITSW